MEEESEFDPVEPLPQERGENHQMIILNPDVVVLRVDDFHHPVGEYLVGGDVGLPETAIETVAVVREHGEHIVEERPEVVFTEAAVVLFLNLFWQERGNAVEFRKKLLRDSFLLIYSNISVE